MNNPLQILDQEIKDCKKSPEKLQHIFINYSALAAASSPVLIQEYYTKIDKLISGWIGVVKEAQGLAFLNTGLTRFYQTRFSESTASSKLAIEEFSRIKNLELQGMAHMIRGANYRSLGEIDSRPPKGLKNPFHSDQISKS